MFLGKNFLLLIFFGISGLCIAQIQPVTYLNDMSTNTINSITQDGYGFLWLGTDGGVGRFDGYTLEQQFQSEPGVSSEDITEIFNTSSGDMLIGTHHGAYLYKQLSNQLIHLQPAILKMYIYCFAEDEQHNYWMGTSSGIVILDRNFRVIRRLLNSSIRNYKINDILFADANKIFAGTANGMYLLTFKKGEDVKTAKIGVAELLKHGDVRKMYIDSYRYLWICVNEEILKTKLFDWGTNPSFETIAKNAESVVISKVGNELWFGTRGQGILRFVPQADNHPAQLPTLWIYEKDKSRIENTVLSIRQDKFDNVWIGSLNGFYVVPKEIRSPFMVLRNDPSDDNTPAHNTISSIIVGEDDGVWLATANGLNRFEWTNKEARKFHITHYLDNSLSENRIRDNKLQNIIEYSPGIFLLSTKSTIRFFNVAKHSFFSIPELDKKLNDFNMRYVSSSVKDRNSNIWLAFNVGGLGVIDTKTNQLYRITSPKLLESRIRSVICDHNNNIWFISEEQGLFKLRTAGEKFTVQSLQNFPMSEFGNAYLTALKEDHKGNIWIGTSQGIFIINPGGSIVRPDQMDNFKQNFYVKGFLEDATGVMWASSTKGIYKLSGADAEYYEPLPQRFFSKAQYIFGEAITNDGYLFLGGVNGLIIFNPKDISHNTIDIEPCISGFSILGKTVSPDKKHFKEDINLTRKIVLTYRDDQFSIDFSSLELIDAQTIKYAYRLSGFNQTWIITDAQRRVASYSNLPPGNYVFELKATNNSGIWMKSVRKLQIEVLPAPWKTWWAYTLYFLLISGIIFAVLRAIIVYKLLQHREEMSQWKINYYHNVLNTIKTPLSLIQAPLNNIIDNFDTLAGDKIKESLYIIQANAKRLSHFVRQLAEFRKIDLGKASLKLTEIDMIQFAQSVFNAFQPLAQEKGLNFVFESGISSAYVIVDAEKMEMILFNLISNAVKFTEQGGEITLSCSMDSSEEKLWIQLKDTGIGIEKENHERIFERFWTSDLSNPATQLKGTGIGLSLVKDFVELHGSKIFVQSAPNEGSAFKFYIRTDSKYKDMLRATQTVQQREVSPFYSTQHIGIEKYAYNISKKSSGLHLPLIYCIDSDTDLLKYLKNELSDMAEVEIFSSIPDAKKNISSRQPDLLILEAMFVNSTIGLEFCKQIKDDNYTNHILVIILSGLGSEEDKLKAYESGADAFILKPFDVSFLKMRIQSLLKLRSKVREKLKNELIVNPKEVEISSDKDLFLANAMNLIEENISSEDFGVDQLADKLNVTRSMLYRRFRMLVNQSPAEYIKIYRLKRAAQLLEQTSYNVTEVSAQVGFSDTRNFSKLFKEQYGVLPKSYSLSKKKKQ